MGMGFSSERSEEKETFNLGGFARDERPTKLIADGNGGECTVEIGALYRATYEPGRGVIFILVTED